MFSSSLDDLVLPKVVAQSQLLIEDVLPSLCADSPLSPQDNVSAPTSTTQSGFFASESY